MIVPLLVLVFVQSIGTGNFERYYRRGSELMDQGDWGQARINLERARKYRQTPDLERRIHVVTARLYLEEGDRFFRNAAYQEAADRYRRAVALDPGYAPAQKSRDEALARLYCANGLRFLTEGALPEARQQFLECLTWKPDDIEDRERLRSVEESLAAVERHKRRIHYAAVLAPAATSVYVLLLLFGLYSGIRRTLP